MRAGRLWSQRDVPTHTDTFTEILELSKEVFQGKQFVPVQVGANWRGCRANMIFILTGNEKKKKRLKKLSFGRNEVNMPLIKALYCHLKGTDCFV